jgi:hypothetical protein
LVASKEGQRDQTTNIHGGEIGQRKSKMGRRKPKKSEVSGGIEPPRVSGGH